MRKTRLIMGMPITVEILESPDGKRSESTLEKVFDYFIYVDRKFSTYKEDSEIMRINRKEILPEDYSQDMREILVLAEKTKAETDGYFDIVNKNGIMDPSGVVKGWSISRASEIIEKDGFKNYYVDAGGDIQIGGVNKENKAWKIGIENPFKPGEIIKTVFLNNQGIATSGTYLRGQHIYNPKDKDKEITEIVSLSVIGKDILEADRFATPAFAMGKAGINFIENVKGLEGYMVDNKGIATMTSGFERYTSVN